MPSPSTSSARASAKLNRLLDGIINASNRGTHKVPARRKAPAGHAKNYAGQMARGLDGKLWQSRQVAVKNRLTWRWKPAATTLH